MFKGFLKMAVMAGCLFLGVEHIGNTCVWAEVDILREALNNNQIRVAGPEIIKKWERKRIELYEKAGMKIDLSEFYYTIPAYEILSPAFAFPAALPMLAAVDYYLPESFELPEGDIRHLRIFLLEDGTCTGHGSECVDLTGDSLRVAINKKHIRIAYPETIKQWEQKRIELYEKAGLKINPADFKYIRNDSAYEILSPDFVFPDGLSGADSVDFYLPESFQIPEGDTWSIGIFMLEDGACLGHGFGCVQLREDSLREAINREHIRIVRPETIKKWAEKALALYTEAGLEVDEVYFRKPAHSNAFEIISSGFVIPDGLAGADSVSFYLPENLKIPPGPFGHSNMYLLKDGSCLGHGTYCTDIRDN